MKTHNSTVILPLLSTTIALCASGCSLTHKDLFADGTLTLERVPTEGITVVDAEAYRDGDGLVVSGHVTRQIFGAPSRGHIHVIVISPDGEILERTSARHSIVSKGRRRRAAFEARLDSVPPKGSTIRIVRQGGTHDVEEESYSTPRAHRRPS